MARYLQIARTVVSGVSLIIGVLFTLAPRRGAAWLGFADDPRLMRTLGIGDLALGTALMRSEKGARWMGVRAAANIGLAGLYARTLAGQQPRQPRTRTGFAMMVILSVVDGLLAWLMGRQSPSSSGIAHDARSHALV